VDLQNKKRNVFLAILNSGFFLWLLSAIFLAAGGSYFTNYQDCMRDAEKLISQHDRLTREIRNRRSFVWSLVASAKSIGEIRGGLDKCPVTYSEFKEFSTFELQQSINRLQRQIDKTNMRLLPPDLADGRFRFSQLQQLGDCNFPGDRAYIYADPDNRLKSDILKFYYRGENVDALNLSTIKEFAEYKQRQMRAEWLSGEDLLPSCRVDRLLDRIRFGAEAKIASYPLGQ